MGHLYSNLVSSDELDLDLGELPPEEFLTRVYHTHIHSLNDAGRTHFPLTEDYTLPIESYVNALQQVNYNGVYNLELSFDRFEKNAPVAKQVVSSVNKLKKLQNVEV